MNERLTKAGLLSLVGAGLGASMGFALSIVVGRQLGDSGAGRFFSVIAAFTIAANVLELGADTGLVRMLSRYVALRRSADIPRTILVALVPVVAIGTVAMAGLWLAAPLIFSGNDAASVTDQFRHVVPFVLVASLLLVVLGATRGLGSVKPFTFLWNVAVPVSRPVLVGLVVAAAGAGLHGALSAWSWPLVPALAVAIAVLARQVRQVAALEPAPGDAEPVPTRQLAREFWGFSAPRGVAATLEIFESWVDVLLVAALRSPAEAGVYAVVSRAATSGMLVEAAARIAIGPRISAQLALDDRPGAAVLQRQATQAMILVAWPFYVTLAVFGPVVLRVFGHGFDDGATALIILSAAMMVRIAGGVVQSILLMGGRSSWQLGNKGLALTTLVVGNLVLDPPFGIVGAASAWALAIGVDTVLANWQVSRRMHVAGGWASQVPMALTAVGMFAGIGLAIRVTLGATPLALLVHLVVAGGAYAVVCLRMRHTFSFDVPKLSRPARATPTPTAQEVPV